MREGVTEPVRVDNPQPLGPAGRVHLSMEEWSRFVLAFTRDRREGDEPRLGVSPCDEAVAACLDCRLLPFCRHRRTSLTHPGACSPDSEQVD